MALLPLDLTTDGQTKTFYIQATETSTTKGDAKIVMTHNGQEQGKKESTAIDLDVEIENTGTIGNPVETGFIVNHGTTCGETTCKVSLDRVQGVDSFTVYLTNKVGGVDVKFNGQDTPLALTLNAETGAPDPAPLVGTFKISTATPKTVSSKINDIVIEVHQGSTTGQVIDEGHSTAVKFDIMWLGFSGENHYYVASDDGKRLYEPGQWLDLNLDGDTEDGRPECSWPTCFVAGSQMKLAVDFRVQGPKMEGLDLPPQVELLGYKPGAGDLDPTYYACLSLYKNLFSLEPINFDLPLANEVACWDPMEIRWKVSFDGVTKAPITTTKNPLYVLADDPNISDGVPLYHTLVKVGCQAAQGRASNDTAGIIADIWAEFANRDIHRADDDAPLSFGTHYHWTFVNTDAALLEKGEGDCSAWSWFLIDTLRAQGIANGPADGKEIQPWMIRTANSVKPMGRYDESKGFLIAKWDFDPQKLQYTNVAGWVDENNRIIKPDATQYDWLHAELDDLIGIRGQGNANPPSLFAWHVIIKIDGELYDPSYGVTSPNLDAYEASFVVGYYSRSLGTWNNQKAWVYTIQRDQPGNGNQLCIPGFLTR